MILFLILMLNQFKSEKQDNKNNDEKKKNLQTSKLDCLFSSILDEGRLNLANNVQLNSKKTIISRTIALSFSFMLGYIIGMNTTTNRNFSAVNNSLSLINKQNMEISRKLEELNAKYAELSAKVKNIEIDSKSRLSTIENKIQFKEATQKGEEHVKKMEKKKGWKKLLPWNWF